MIVGDDTVTTGPYVRIVIYVQCILVSTLAPILSTTRHQRVLPVVLPVLRTQIHAWVIFILVVFMQMRANYLPTADQFLLMHLLSLILITAVVTLFLAFPIRPTRFKSLLWTIYILTLLGVAVLEWWIFQNSFNMTREQDQGPRLSFTPFFYASLIALVTLIASGHRKGLYPVYAVLLAAEVFSIEQFLSLHQKRPGEGNLGPEEAIPAIVLAVTALDLIRSFKSADVNNHPSKVINVGGYGTFDREAGVLMAEGNVYDDPTVGKNLSEYSTEEREGEASSCVATQKPTRRILPCDLEDANAATASQAAPVPKVPRDFREQVRVRRRLVNQMKKGIPLWLGWGALAAVVDAIRHTEPIDDRKMLLEHALTFTSRLPEGKILEKLQNKIVKLLYNDLSHPPATSLGNKYAWRLADGSHNNIDVPDMGKAGTPYARSVQQAHPLPKNALPDAGLVFDTLLRREGFVKHPAGLSSLFFNFAALFVHSMFRTSYHDVNINDTSSYVDLSPLYGHNQEAQDRVRIRDGRGLLYPDVFAEDRLLLLPPAVCSLLVLFNRNHNYIAKKLLEINERGKWVDPSTISPDNPQQWAQLKAQEEEVFQIARLINSGWFASVMFSDYFSCILGLVRQGNSWSMSPFGEIRNDDHSAFERGRGNVCSVEFNCLYRWHASTSVEDEAWVQTVFDNIFEGQNPEAVTPAYFKATVMKVQAMIPDIEHWTFGNLKRQGDGTFKDEDLAGLIHDATEHPAGAFKARGTPAVMRLHEIMGIEQNRAWGVCSLNDFRKFLGLKPYKTFLEWNPYPEIAEAAEKLYGDIEKLELYVGLHAEEAKPVCDGAGLCPGYTISRAILSDAMALTRGDRFFTHDFTPFNLTAWGFADCQRDPSAFGFGSTLGRLFLRTLPNHFSPNGVYTFFPLMTPAAMKVHLTDMDVINKYDLLRPKPIAPIQTVKDYPTVVHILKSDDFIRPYADQAAKVIKSKGFFTAEDNPKMTFELLEILSSKEVLEQTGTYFYKATKDLITANSYSLVGGTTLCVDLVRDVVKYVPIYWAATEVGGIQLKTKENPHNDLAPSQLFSMLSDIYTFIFFDVEPSKIRGLEEKVEKHVEKLLDLIRGNLNMIGSQRLSVASITGTLSRILSKQQQTHPHELVTRLYQIVHSTEQLANVVLAIMVSSVELSLALANTLNERLVSDHDKLADFYSLVSTPSCQLQLEGYIYEAFRLDPPFRGVYRTSTKDQTVSSLSIPKGTRIFLNVSEANWDSKVFPSPEMTELARPRESYIVADGLFKALGQPLTLKIMSEVVRGTVDSGANLRRAPGQSGELKRFKDDSQPMLQYAYLDDRQLPCPWPTSFVVQYDVAQDSQSKV